jgi:hypothetical protein
VDDGDLWWMYSPHWGAISNVGLSDEEQVHYGTGEQFKSLLDPSGLSAVLDFGSVEADGERLRVRARPRDDDDGLHGRFNLHLATGADAFELAVDRERGGAPRQTDAAELELDAGSEIAFDEEFPGGTFVFVPPAGEEVRSPETVSHRQYSLEEAAEAAPFQVFAIPELPEGQWRLNVHFHERRERPPVPPVVMLFYHRSDGRQTLILSERAAGEGAPSWPGIDPQLEEVERDGVRYTVSRAEPEQGGQAAVAFERDGTAIQAQSGELDVDTLLELAASLEPVS